MSEINKIFGKLSCSDLLNLYSEIEDNLENFKEHLWNEWADKIKYCNRHERVKLVNKLKRKRCVPIANFSEISSDSDISELAQTT